MMKTFAILTLLFVSLYTMAQERQNGVKAEIKNKKVKLVWDAAVNESDINYYLIECSSSGRVFRPVAFIKPAGKNQYFWYDSEFYTGTIYYQVKTVSHLHKAELVGTVIAFQIIPGQKEISVYPDLKSSFTLYAEISRLEDDQVTLEIIDADGFVMTNCNVSDTGVASCPVLTNGVIQKINCSVTAVVSDKIIRMRLNIYDASMNMSSDTQTLVSKPLLLVK